MGKTALSPLGAKHTPKFSLDTGRAPLTEGLSNRTIDQQIADLQEQNLRASSAVEGTMFDSRRVAKPGYKPTSNGCGSTGLSSLAPDGSFKDECDAHDIAFGTYDKFGREDFNKKNAAFREALNRDCAQSVNPLCQLKADIYADAVTGAEGWDAYNAAQYDASVPVQEPWKPLSDAVPKLPKPSFDFSQ